MQLSPGEQSPARPRAPAPTAWTGLTGTQSAGQIRGGRQEGTDEPEHPERSVLVQLQLPGAEDLRS